MILADTVIKIIISLPTLSEIAAYREQKLRGMRCSWSRERGWSNAREGSASRVAATRGRAEDKLNRIMRINSPAWGLRRLV